MQKRDKNGKFVKQKASRNAQSKTVVKKRPKVVIKKEVEAKEESIADFSQNAKVGITTTKDLVGKLVKIYRYKMWFGFWKNKAETKHYTCHITNIQDGLIFTDITEDGHPLMIGGHPLMIGLASVKSIVVLD